MSQSDSQVFRERALRDKSAIIELRQNAAFNDYFMRRLSQGVENATKELKYAKITPEAREQVRLYILAYEEIQGWVSDSEIASCDRIVNQ